MCKFRLMPLTQEKAPEEKAESASQIQKGKCDNFRENMDTHVTIEDAELQLDTTQNKSCKQQETEVVDK